MKLNPIWLTCAISVLTIGTLHTAHVEFMRGLKVAAAITVAGAVVVGPSGVGLANTVAFVISCLDICSTGHPRSRGLAVGSGTVIFLMCASEQISRNKDRRGLRY